MPPRRATRRSSSAAALPRDEQEQARPATRQRTEEAPATNADVDALAPANDDDDDDNGAAPAAAALADHSHLLRDADGLRARAHARAVARAAHFAVFDEGEEGGGAGGGRGGGGDAATADAAHTGGERPAARELGMWATSQALLEGRSAAAAARREAAAAKAKAAAAPTLIRWSPRKRPRDDDDETAPATPAPLPHGVGRVPSLLRMTAELVAENLDVVESLEGVPDGARAAVALAASRRRTLDAPGAMLLSAGRPSDVSLPDASKLDAASMAALLAQALHPGIETLELGFCGRGLGDSTAVAAAERASSSSPSSPPLPLLSRLSLGGAYRLSDRGLSSLLSLCPNLERLSVPQAPKVTGAAVASLPTLVPSLKSLDVAHCRGVDADSLLSALLGDRGVEGEEEGGRGQPKPFLAEIEEVVLDGLVSVDDSLLLELSRAMRASASSADKSKKLPLGRLSRVSLRQCSGVTDEGVVALLEAASEAAAADAASLSSSSVPSYAPLSSRPARYYGLESLCLDGCGVTDATLDALASRFPQPLLEKLSLAGCKSLSDEGLARAVEGVAVAGASSSAAAAAAGGASSDDPLEDSVPGLRSLSVAGVPDAGEHLVAALLRSCPRSLEDIDVSWCRRVPAVALGALADGCPRLRRISSYGCTHVGEEVVNGHGNPRTVFVGAASVKKPPPRDAEAALVLE